MNVLVFLFSATLLLATVIPLSRRSNWWIRVWDFPRLQLSFLALISLSLAALNLDGTASYAALLISLLCLLGQFYWIYPYTGIASTEVAVASSNPKGDSISVITANVLMTNRNADKLIEIVRNKDPDVLLTLESDKWWEEKLDSLQDRYPFTVKCPLDNLYGMHVYSKLALHKSTVEYLVEDDIPSIHTEIELPSGKRIRTHFHHPNPPVPEYSSSSSERDAELIVLARSLQDCEDPIIVAGDFNDVAWSATTRLFKKISGLLDPRIGRGMFNTFNAKHWYVRWPLDHLFHSAHFQLSDISRLEYFGSDHFALFTKLVYVHTKVTENSRDSVNEEDESFADEKLEAHDIETDDIPMDEGK